MRGWKVINKRERMTTTDVLAIIGAVTGIIGTIAGLFALCWDYYKWKYAERVQLKVTAIPNFVNAEDRRKEMIWVSVTNIGKIPTTINFLPFMALIQSVV